MTAEAVGRVPASLSLRTPRARTLFVAVALCSLVYGAVGACLDTVTEGEPLWDLDTYRAAAARWLGGNDPYLSRGSPTGYYYSPSLTPLLAWAFDGFDAKLGYGLIAALTLAATLALSIAAMRPRADETALCWLYAAAFGNTEVAYALATGNLALFNGLLLAAALFAASRGRWAAFYLLVGLASLLKPYILLLLALPLALGALSRLAALALVPLAVDTALAWTLWPGLAASRVDAIMSGIIEPLRLRFSLTGRLSRIFASQLDLDGSTATLAAVAIQLAVAAALVLILRKRSAENGRRAFALAAVAALATQPRMAGYDAFAFGPAVFVAFLPRAEDGLSRGAQAVVALALVLGLFKEGLAYLPLVALAVFPHVTSAGSAENSAQNGGAGAQSETAH